MDMSTIMTGVDLASIRAHSRQEQEGYAAEV